MSHFNPKASIVRFSQLQLSLLVALTALVAGLGSCASPSSQNGTPPGASQSSMETSPQALSIVTTTIPVTDFTKAVVGDRAAVRYLLPPNTDPHDFQARPNDVRMIATADILVQNGLELESYLDNLVSNAGNTELKIIDTSEGIQPFTREAEHAEAGHTEAEHAQDEHEHAQDEVTASGVSETEAAGEKQAEGHEHGEFDPHIWLDPKRAIQQVENIRDGLIAADPEGEETYTANAEAYINQLKALDAEITETLKPYAGEEFITYHDFAFYFAQSYGLKAEYFVGMPEENPSPEDVKRVLETAQTENLKVLLTEPQAGDGQFAALAQDLDVQVSSFDPIETSDEQGLEPGYYLKTMQQNVENLKAAFAQVQ